MKRHYPALPPDTHPAIQTAVNTLYDHVYTLRDENEKLRGQMTEMGKQSSQKKQFTGDIQGILVKAVTDPSSLKNGYTLRYSTATGQFEFGP